MWPYWDWWPLALKNPLSKDGLGHLMPLAMVKEWVLFGKAMGTGWEATYLIPHDSILRACRVHTGYTECANEDRNV